MALRTTFLLSIAALAAAAWGVVDGVSAVPALNEVPVTEAEEDASVRRWRTKQLLDLDFAPQLADRVARDFRFDWHQLETLVKRGCTPELAVVISEPL